MSTLSYQYPNKTFANREQPIASIIVPTCNRAGSLALTLRSLLAQHLLARYELLIIDNRSTDNTRTVAQDAITAYPVHMIRYVYEPVPGLLSGRHRGVNEARSDLLIFVDDDINAGAGWLEAIVRSFEDPVVQMVGGPSLPMFESPPPDWLSAFWTGTPYGGRMCCWLSLLDLGERQIVIDPTLLWGLNFGIRRQALIDAGGFHPDCVPDDLQRWQGDGESGLAMGARRAGLLALYQNKARVYHRIPASRLTPEYFGRRAYYQGVCDSYTQIRANASLHSGQEPANKLGWSSDIAVWLRRHARTPLKALHSFFHRAWQAWLAHPLAGAVREDSQVLAVRERVRQAYDAGFEFHQESVRANPEVLEWVLRKDYWDYRFPGATASADRP